MTTEKLPYSHDVEKRVRQLVRDGVGVRVIIDSIQDLPYAPRSLSTLYKKYGQAIADERAEFHSWLGGKARERIEEGSDKILELALRSKAGWNPTIVTEEKDSEDADENQDALSVLMEKLGKKQDDES